MIFSSKDGAVSIYESTDNSSWTKLAEAADEASYKYEIIEDFLVKYIKAKQKTESGTIESEPFIAMYSEGGYICTWPDSDSDTLTDWSEANVELLHWQTDGSIILPTIKEHLDTEALNRFVLEYGGSIPSSDMNIIIGTHILPAVSHPKNPDGDGDDLLDVEEYDLKTDPLNCDTDSDRLWDGEEYYIETDPLKCDTDGDGLSDHWEVMLWFDPLNANPDGDTFSDYDELIYNTSPYEYNLSVDEALGEFWQGALLGDWETADSIEQLVGQIASSFVPFVGDARDYFANITVNMDTVSGLLNLGGFLLDFVAVGAAADAVKIGPKVGKFVEKFAKNASKVTEGIVQVLKRIPNQSDEILIAVAKAVPAGAYDDIAMSIKNGDNITKADYLKLQDLFQAAGKNLDNSIDDILGDLDWDTIVSQKGETRIAHIQRHMIPNPIRKNHGVFNGNAEEMVNAAWNNRHGIQPLDDGMGGSIYNIPFPNAGYESGTENTGEVLNFITIITKRGTNQLFVAFPSNGRYSR